MARGGSPGRRTAPSAGRPPRSQPTSYPWMRHRAAIERSGPPGPAPRASHAEAQPGGHTSGEQAAVRAARPARSAGPARRAALDLGGGSRRRRPRGRAGDARSPTEPWRRGRRTAGMPSRAVRGLRVPQVHQPVGDLQAPPCDVEVGGASAEASRAARRRPVLADVRQLPALGRLRRPDDGGAGALRTRPSPVPETTTTSPASGASALKGGPTKVTGSPSAGKGPAEAGRPEPAQEREPRPASRCLDPRQPRHHVGRVAVDHGVDDEVGDGVPPATRSPTRPGGRREEESSRPPTIRVRPHRSGLQALAWCDAHDRRAGLRRVTIPARREPPCSAASRGASGGRTGGSSRPERANEDHPHGGATPRIHPAGVAGSSTGSQHRRRLRELRPQVWPETLPWQGGSRGERVHDVWCPASYGVVGRWRGRTTAWTTGRQSSSSTGSASPPRRTLVRASASGSLNPRAC